MERVKDDKAKLGTSPRINPSAVRLAHVMQVHSRTNAIIEIVQLRAKRRQRIHYVAFAFVSSECLFVLDALSDIINFVDVLIILCVIKVNFGDENVSLLCMLFFFMNK